MKLILMALIEVHKGQTIILPVTWRPRAYTVALESDGNFYAARYGDFSTDVLELQRYAPSI